MDLNLSIPALLNAGGGLMFFLIGIAILWVARGSPRGRLVGGLAASFGITFVLQNLFDNRDPVAAWLIVASNVPVIVLSLLLTRHLLAGLGPRPRREVAGLGAAAACCVALGATAVAVTPEFPPAFGYPGGPTGVIFFAAFFVLCSSLLLLLAGCMARVQAGPAGGGRERRAFGLLGLAYGSYAAFYFATIPAGYMAGVGWRLAAASVVAFMVLAIVPIAWVMRRSPDSRLSRLLFLSLVLFGLVGFLVRVVPGFNQTSFGLYGIVRTLGAVMLVVSVAKYDLLGVPLPRLAVKRGTLAMGALAALFIVAQVAQNFFAAEYGLLMGGVVAGAVVFAASPIQRVMERASDRSPSATRPSAGRRGGAAKESTYRLALGIALRDKRLTREEVLGLAQLADELGLTHRRAKEIWLDVEAGQTGRDPR